MAYLLMAMLVMEDKEEIKMKKYIGCKGEIMEELKDFITDKRFLAGLVLGFTLGALHHYFAL